MSPKVWEDHRGNWYGKCNLSINESVSLVIKHWLWRRRYFCDGLFRVQVPAIIDGKSLFETGICSYETKISLISPEIEVSPLDDKKQIFDKYGEIKYYRRQAAYAEFIVARSDWLKAENRYIGHECEIINFHALPFEDVPPYLLEMVDNVLRRPNDYQYSKIDWIQSTYFWSNHCFIRSLR